MAVDLWSTAGTPTSYPAGPDEMKIELFEAHNMQLPLDST
jgi:hypothetical protein